MVLKFPYALRISVVLESLMEFFMSKSAESAASSSSSGLPSVLAVIPARYASTRFPGKPLVDIQGKPMIQHVWERIRQVAAIQRVVVATDDARIQQAAEGFGAEVCLTSSEHPSGTDRAWEVASGLPEYDWVLNVQGDEPFINPAHLEAAIVAISEHPEADIITLVTPLTDVEAWHDPNIVKAVLAQNGRALYFSRSPVPFHRDEPEVPAQVFRHIGLYLYRRSTLEQFTQLPPSTLECIEKLEQLRALEADMKLFGVLVSEAPIGVDTPQDLLRFKEHFY
jgi:3-deoxy-manno-octulosonate cytidylyltransferase (CMP-KDO synthetase)